MEKLEERPFGSQSATTGGFAGGCAGGTVLAGGTALTDPGMAAAVAGAALLPLPAMETTGGCGASLSMGTGGFDSGEAIGLAGRLDFVTPLDPCPVSALAPPLLLLLLVRAGGADFCAIVGAADLASSFHLATRPLAAALMAGTRSSLPMRFSSIPALVSLSSLTVNFIPSNVVIDSTAL